MKKKIIIPLIIIISIITVYFVYLINNPESLIELLKKHQRGALVEKTVSIKDHEIRYLESGEGETIVLLHGLGGAKDDWAVFAKKLLDKYHVIVLDLPGFGDSTRSFDKNYNISIQTERLNEFAKKLNLKKFHIAGNSMGGHISALYAHKYHEKVITLCLLDSAGVLSEIESDFMKNLRKGNNKLLVNSVEDFDRLLNYIFYKPPYIPGLLKKSFAEKAFNNRKFNSKVTDDLKEEFHTLNSVLPSIKNPVLIIWGDSDRIIDISSVKIFEKYLENSTTVVLEKCGHLPMLEMPDETAEHYLKFLEKNKTK